MRTGVMMCCYRGLESAELRSEGRVLVEEVQVAL
jgi:hypothetical protein